MEAVDKALIMMFNVKDYDVSDSFTRSDSSSLPRSLPNSELKRKRIEMEGYYFQVGWSI